MRTLNNLLEDFYKNTVRSKYKDIIELIGGFFKDRKNANSYRLCVSNKFCSVRLTYGEDSDLILNFSNDQQTQTFSIRLFQDVIIDSLNELHFNPKDVKMVSIYLEAYRRNDLKIYIVFHTPSDHEYDQYRVRMDIQYHMSGRRISRVEPKAIDLIGGIYKIYNINNTKFDIVEL